LGNSTTVTATNIVAGTILSQIFIFTIMFAALLLIRRNPSFSRWSKGLTNHTGLIFIISTAPLISIAALVLSDNYSTTWTPLFNYVGYYGWSWSTAVCFTFIVNIIALSLLVAYTGGSINSPFQPLYFLIPTLALFLHETDMKIIIYTAIVAISFALQVYVYEPINLSESDTDRHKIAYIVVSLLCLCSACIIGIFTRPQI